MSLEPITDIIGEIQERMETCNNSERRVGEVVLANPHDAINMSIGQIAQLANVSDPTVVRFCRSLGFGGFREFKLRLAQGLASEEYTIHRKVQFEDDTDAYMYKVGQFALEGLTDVVNQLNKQEVEHAVSILATAKRIEFWGFGASAVVAADAHHKFFRLGIPCIAYADPHMQVMSASTLEKGTVVVAFSHSGRSKELIDSITLARQTGGTVIGITTPKSPMEQACSHVVSIAIDENTDVFPPMVSRLAHLLLLDMLVVGVSLQKGTQVTNRLKRLKKALSSKRYQEMGGEKNDEKV